MIRDTFASAKPGMIVLSLAPLLSLPKDQVTKLEIKPKRPTLFLFIWMNMAPPKQHVAAITNRILMHPRTSASLILFASPQILGSQYLGLFKLLLNNNMLSMVCIDELHLMAGAVWLTFPCRVPSFEGPSLSTLGRCSS